MYSHSYWLVIFSTTNSSRMLAKERSQTFENFWKKTQYLINTLWHYLLFQVLLNMYQSISLKDATVLWKNSQDKNTNTISFSPLG